MFSPFPPPKAVITHSAAWGPEPCQEPEVSLLPPGSLWRHFRRDNVGSLSGNITALAQHSLQGSVETPTERAPKQVPPSKCKHSKIQFRRHVFEWQSRFFFFFFWLKEKLFFFLKTSILLDRDTYNILLPFVFLFFSSPLVLKAWAKASRSQLKDNRWLQ